MNDEVKKNFEKCLVDAIEIVERYKLYGNDKTLATVKIAKILYDSRW